MNLNIRNIPMAIIYFVIGVFINIVIYYAISPDQADLIGILNSLSSEVGFSMEASTTGVIWIGIMVVSVLINIGYPIWMIVETEEDSKNG